MLMHSFCIFALIILSMNLGMEVLRHTVTLTFWENAKFKVKIYKDSNCIFLSKAFSFVKTHPSGYKMAPHYGFDLYYLNCL